MGPVKKLNFLNNVLYFFVLVKSYREKKNRKFKTDLIISFILLLKEFQEFIFENWNRFLDDCQTALDKNKENLRSYKKT